MSHFTVLVIGNNVEAQLAPYDENDTSIRTDKTDEVRQEYEGPLPEHLKSRYPDYASWSDHPDYPTLSEFASEWHGYTEENGRYYSTYNPKSKWDWYEVGGRWSGFFKLKANSPRKASIELDVYADSALKGEIDFEGMRQDAEVEARATYQRFVQTLGDLPLPPPFKEILDKHEAQGGDADSARKEYWALSAVVKLDKADLMPWGTDVGETFGVGKSEYIQRARNQAVSTYAVVKDGQWYERGRMGWWGMSSNEIPEEEWLKQLNELLDSISDDTLLTLMDCHI